MRRHCFWITGKFDAASTGQSITRFPSGRRTKRLGEINFYESYIGAGVVSHELLHSAIRWLQKLALSDGSFIVANSQASEAEEILCGSLHRMVIGFWDDYYLRLK